MSKKLRVSITVKLTLFIALLVAMTTFVVSFIYFTGASNILIDRAINDIEQEIVFFKEPLLNPVQEAKNDIMIISQLPVVQGIIRAESNNGIDPEGGLTKKRWIDRLEIVLKALMATRPNYTQIRYIEAKNNGKEVLRIERTINEEITRASDDKLQARAEREYFQETVKLQGGDIYLSEVNLNREFGKISEPYRLVLMVATPVFSSKDKKLLGIVVINVNYDNILKEINSETILQSRLLYVVNDRGDYLLHPNKSKLYATDIGHEQRLQNDYPVLQKIMDDNNIKRKTILPKSVNENVLSFVKYTYDTQNQGRYLAIVLQAPYSKVLDKVRELRTQSYAIGIAITVVAIICAVLFLRFLLLPLNMIARAVVEYREGGKKDIPLPTDSPDEIGVLAREFEDMIETKNNEEWVKGNLVSISKEMLGFNELKLFADKLMERLTITVGAQVGVLYLHAHLQQGRDAEEKFLLLGASGYTDKANIPTSFAYGDGLIGQCAKDKNERLINKITKDNLRISSALSDSLPRNLFIIPVLFKSRVVAVMEFASLNDFSNIQLEFIRQIAFNIGVTIDSISANMRTEELLEEARATAEELRRNEEELKTQQEELEASNTEMEEKTKALEEQNERIARQAEELEENKNLIAAKVKELEAANKYKSEFLANISHELRTPLNSLLILAKSLSDNEDGNLTEEQIEEASVIYNGGLDLLNLINDILDLSKVEAGKITISISEVSLEGIADSMKKQFEPIVSGSNVKFTIEYDEDIPDFITTDGQRLAQILKNLLSNAFKFTEQGSVTLKITRPSDDINLKRDGLEIDNSVAFTVVDTGIGISKDKLRDIFEAFQQEDGSIDRHYGGTGLGLTISRKFAHLLGGEIHVDSKKGEGSVFTLYLPEKLSEEQAKVGVAQRVDELKIGEPSKKLPTGLSKSQQVEEEAKKQILIIEDDEDFAKIVAKQAQERGYIPLIANNGRTGLLKVSEQEVDGIILDLRLPDIDGETILEQLKENAKLCHIPVHVITGKADNDNNAIMKKGAIGCLTKPLNKEDIDSVFAKLEELSGRNIKEVLVVEDDKKTQTAIRNLLNKEELNITMASNGKKAMDAIKKQRYDCIILDLNLPDIDGFKWLSQMEKLGKAKQIPPVIIYTAKELTEEENKKLSEYTGSIVIKGVSSSERLLDEVTLFLHSIEPETQRENVQMQHDPDKVLQGRKVLLTDDDLRNTFALSKMLKKHGMEVVIADNGQMALEKLEGEQGIELIIMDIMMPIMDGYEAIKEIRKRENLKNIPIIALTARAMPEEQDKCAVAGANDYMTKPVDVDKLITLIRLWLFKQQKAA